MALDATTHTLYVGDAHDGLVSMINTATCNAMNTERMQSDTDHDGKRRCDHAGPPTLSVYATDMTATDLRVKQHDL